jgi:hypothetical protein
MNEEIEELDQYKDYTYIMYILCDKTSSYYSKIKNTINIPIVVCSTGLSMMNSFTSYDIEFSHKIQYISITLNIFIALSLSILNIFKITEKEFFFSSQSTKFLKMYNKINLEISKERTTTVANCDIFGIITEYNILCEHIQFHFPSHIRNRVIKRYRRYKLPFLANSTIKEHINAANYFKEQQTDTDMSSLQESIKSPTLTSSTSYTYFVSDSAPNTPHLNCKNKTFVPKMSPVKSVIASPLQPAYISSGDDYDDINEIFDIDKIQISRKKNRKRSIKKK